MLERDYKFFNVAKSMAALSTWSELPREQIGAILVLRNEIVAAAYNRRKTSPTQAYWAEKAGRPEAIWQHAEIGCLNHLAVPNWNPNLAKIYVYRETKQGIALAKPCEICTMALRHFNVKHVFYTTQDGYCEEVWD